MNENEYSVPQSRVGNCAGNVCVPSPMPATLVSVLQLTKPPRTSTVQLRFGFESPTSAAGDRIFTPDGTDTLNASKPLLLTTRRFGSAPCVSARAKSKFITA